MDYNEIKHLLKAIELTQELNKEKEQAKILCDDIEDGKTFNIDGYLDALFGDSYNELEDCDIEEDSESVSDFLSTFTSRDLIISLIISLCVARLISIGDIVVVLDKLQKNNHQ